MKSTEVLMVEIAMETLNIKLLKIRHFQRPLRYIFPI